MISQIAVTGIPLDENSSFLRGPALAPPKIREAFHSNSANYFTESGIDLNNHPGWKDEGDLSFDKDSKTHPRITEHVRQLLVRHNKILVLGGDHSITFPVVQAFHKKHGPLTILHLDAHPDLYDDFEGNPHSHASPFARIMELGLATRLVQVGIRTLNAHQKDQAKRLGVEVFEMKNWNAGIQLKLGGPVYLSLDMDVIDPAFAPGVSHHEPGGFSSREILSILQNLRGTVVGADLVEFNPTRDPSGITAMLAAKLFKEMLDVLLRTQ